MHGTIDHFNHPTQQRPLTVSAKNNTGIPAGTYTGEWSGYFATIKKQSGKSVISYRFRTATGNRGLTPVRIIIQSGYAKVYQQ